MHYKMILIVVILTISCRKSGVLEIPETDVPPVYFGESTLFDNGILRNNFLPYAFKYPNGVPNKNYGIVFYVYDSRNFKRIGLEFSYFYFKPFSYNIRRSISYPNTNSGSTVVSSYAILGGNAVEYSYDVDSIKPCILNITSVDSATKELWGTFQGTYKLKPNNNTNANTTQQIEITNGTLHTKVFE
jgi:hypothetical protein